MCSLRHPDDVAEAAQSEADPDAKPYIAYAQAIEAELGHAGIGQRDKWLITDKGLTPYVCEENGC